MRDDKGLKRATVAVVFCGYLALATSIDYGAIVLLLPLAGTLFMPFGEALDRRYAAFAQVTGLGVFGLVVTLPIIVRQLGLLHAVVALVIFIQLYCFVHVKSPSRYGYLFLMAFFQVLAACVLSPSAEIGIAMFAFVLSSMWMLFQLEMYRASDDAERLPAVRVRPLDTVTESLGEPQEMGAGVRVGGVLAASTLLAVVFSSMMFVSIPRTEAGLIGSTDQPGQFETGTSMSMDLSVGGEIAADRSPVMQVKFMNVPGGNIGDDMLWRVMALDYYTRSGWEPRQIGMSGRYGGRMRERYFVMAEPVLAKGRLARESLRMGELLRYTIFLPKAPDGPVPALDRVHSLAVLEPEGGVSARWDRTGDFAVTLSEEADSGVMLEVLSEAIDVPASRLRDAGSQYPMMSRNEHAYMTEQDLLDETKALVLRITDGATTPYDQLKALESYLRGDEFVYTTITPNLPTENPVDEFLLNQKSGHCQLFASAMVLMARSLGIPARVVSGYRGATWDASDESYTVTNDRAHVWVEALFPGIGWIAFDPSPVASEPEFTAIDSFGQYISSTLLKVRLVWMRDIIGFRPAERSPFTGTLDLRLPSFLSSQDSEEKSAGGSLRIPIVPLLVFLLGGGAWLFLRGFRLPGRVAVELTADQKRARDVYRRLRRRLASLGLRVSNASANELLEESRLHLGMDAESIAAICDAYESVRFGGRGLSAQRYRALKLAVAGLKRTPPAHVG